ncbi:tudor and KH domain-containing protein-like isoform X2 [Poecile atricapillus]|uniref:tudor and KH domain-containing protein-like isoform X2 n=1 Tax=Poecile atricapillus TaxID=48891 RepID=UPI002738B4C5|nr:tudor and KH domain-containing protein-like isoform X2 [Poecile atricapillus]
MAGSVHSLSGLQKTALLLGVPAAATVLYILYRRYRESREAQVTLVADEGLEVAVRVPRTALKSLIGRRGATINQLRQETGAQIDVEEEEEEEGGQSLVQISGSPGQVCRARAAVLRIVADSAPVAEQLRVPQHAVGRIIGRGGETVRGICRSSGARVECGQEPGASLAPLRCIRLLGTRKEVEVAKRLILEKLSEEQAFRSELAQAAAARCPRKQPLGSRREPPGPLPAVPTGPGGCQEHWDTERAAETPGWGTETPGQGTETPSQGTETPGQGMETPNRGTETPNRGMETPSQGMETPNWGTETPSQGMETPGQGMETPSQGMETPNRDMETPSQGTETPSQGLETPSQGTETPSRGTETPNQALKTPNRGMETPNRGTETPSQGLEPGTEPQEPPVPKFEVPSPDFSFAADEHLHVYVSAAESPGHFWIQLLGTRSLQLDKLTAEMGHFYQSSPAVPPPSVHPGAIVAAPYLEDGEWYRARVLGTLDNGHLDLYYVDFGDNGEAPPEALRALRSDFLSLPFQAIECSLAGIVPNGDTWQEAALDEFDRLTHCAQWTPLVARICSYGQSGLGTRPSVRLFTEHHGQSLDVGAELVRLGYAVPGPAEEPSDDLGCASPPSPGAAPGAAVPPQPPR